MFKLNEQENSLKEDVKIDIEKKSITENLPLKTKNEGGEIKPNSKPNSKRNNFFSKFYKKEDVPADGTINHPIVNQPETVPISPPDISEQKIEKQNLYSDNVDMSIIDEVIEYFITSSEDSKLLFDIQKEWDENRKEQKKAALMLKAKRQLQLRNVENIDIYIESLRQYLWGFHVLQGLMDDPDVYDIKVLAYDQIVVSRKGIEEFDDKVRFANEKDFQRFIDAICVKNKINFSDINAVQTFPDRQSHKDFRLRISLSSPYVNGVDNCYIHFRKHRKVKKTLEYLREEGMITREQATYLMNKVKKGASFIFTGAGGSGKTTLYNALLDHLNCSGIIIDESEELFMNKRSKLMFLHSVSKKGEGKVEYTLGDLARYGLKTNQKMFGIGEITGDEAKYFMMAGNTGHICWTSSHGNNEFEAIDKLADYIVHASGYSFNAAKKFLVNMLGKDGNILFLKDYKLQGISSVEGYDETVGEIKYKEVDIKKSLNTEDLNGNNSFS